jgi:hypothetical protein
MWSGVETKLDSLRDFGARRFPVTWASEGPEAMSAGCSPPESEFIAEVPLATPRMQAVQDSWMGLITRRASGVWFFLGGVEFGESHGSHDDMGAQGV